MIFRASATRPNSAADRKRNEHLPRGSRDQIGHDLARIAGGGDVEKHQLIRALRVVALGQFDRIARIAQTDES